MNKYRSPVINIIFAVILVFLAACICYSLIAAPKSDKGVTLGSEMQWYYSADVEADFNDPYQFGLLVGQENYNLQTTISEAASNVCLAFQTEFADTEVFADEKKVYSTLESDNSSKSCIFSYDAPAPQIHFVNLENVKSGTVIKMNVTLYHGVKKSGISNIIYGKSDEITDYVFKSNLFGIFLCAALFVCGVIMLVYHLVFRKVITLKGLGYAACFAIIFSIYSVAGCMTFLAPSIAGAAGFYTVKCLSYATMLIPLILFFSENTQLHAAEKILQIMSAVQSAAVITIALLSALKAADLYKTHIFTQILSFVQCLIIAGVLLYDLVKRSERDFSDFTISAIYAVFLIGMIVESIIGSGNSIPIIWTVSCLLFVIAVMSVSMRNIAETLKLSDKVEKIGKIAYTDGLTGVGNTAAFQKKLKNLEITKVNYKSIGIVQFDVNNLKVINDNLGHEMGDLLITDGSSIIKKAFAPVGDVYRVGGDEFVALVYGDNAMADCSIALNNFDDYIEDYNKVETHKFLLQIAYGVEFYRGDSDNSHLTLKEVQKLADANMYDKKRKMKSKITKEQVLKIK